MKKLYIFKVGQTFNKTKEKIGDFDDWIKDNIDIKSFDIEIIDVLNDDKLPDYNTCLGVIITGSHSMVTENLPWSVNVEKWIQKAKKKNIPILGICYGHQLLGKALGGIVDNNPNGKEIGTVKIFTSEIIKEDKLFKNAPKEFQAHVTHMQSILSLPKDAISLGFNTHDKNQIVRFSDFIWGVQFHPEFNEIVMKEYICEQEKELTKQGFEINKLISEIKPTNYANGVINEFIKVIKVSPDQFYKEQNHT